MFVVFDLLAFCSCLTSSCTSKLEAPTLAWPGTEMEVQEQVKQEDDGSAWVSDVTLLCCAAMCIFRALPSYRHLLHFRQEWPGQVTDGAKVAQEKQNIK